MKQAYRYITFVMALLYCGCLFAQTEQPPNILFIIADDLGYGDLQCYGNPVIETPNINRLAADGTMFTQYYSPSPLCAPARAAMLTGRYNHRTGAVDVSSNRGIDRIALSEKTIGDYFQTLGYHTALIGKWHNGLYDTRYLPNNRGFDYFFGFLNGIQDYYRWNLNRNGINEESDGRYLTDVLTNDALSYLELHQEDPFLLVLSYHAPHSPFQAPEKMVRKYRQKANGQYGETVAAIYAMIEVMDQGIGRIMHQLDALGLRQNTIVVFTSDNGPILSGTGVDITTQRFNGALTGMKGWTWEGGVKVPAIIQWPDHLPSGKVFSEPVHGIDWLPTFWELAGRNLSQLPVLDGLSLVPLLKNGKQDALQERPLFFQKNRYYPVKLSDAAVRQGRWKLYWPAIPETMQKENQKDSPSVTKGTTEPHWLMPVDTVIPKWEHVSPLPAKLFDLGADPSERYDVSGKHPGIKKQLQYRYDAWFEDVMVDYERSWAEIKAAERQRHEQ